MSSIRKERGQRQNCLFLKENTCSKIWPLVIGMMISSLVFILYGCGTVPVNVHYQPGATPRQLAPDVKTGIYIAPVIDQTGGPGSYGGNINAQLSLKGPLSTTIVTPYTESLREGLRIELTRLGIPVTDQRDTADAVLEPTLTKTVAYVRSTGMINVPVYGAFEFGLSLKCNRDGLPVWTGEINGYGQGRLSAPGYLRVGSGPNDAMNAALANAMEQIGPAWESDNVLSILSRQCGENP